MARARPEARGNRLPQIVGLAALIGIVVPVALLALGNVIIAWRSLDVALRSNAAIEAKEAVPNLPSLSIVVPARNEERNVARCVRSLLATAHPNFEVIAVDDRSTDATRSILDELADGETRLHVVAGEALPEGWIGKPWALWQGAGRARGEWLLFTDADTEHEPAAAASAQQCALRDGYDVVSLLTDQETISLAERVFLPTILFVIMLGIGAVADVNDPRKRDVAIFNGQYILCSRRAYEGIGGHQAVRGEIAEDLELARRFKRDGRFAIFLAGAAGLVRTRMYATFEEIWQGFVKNFAVGARGRPFDAIAGTLLLACVSPLTPLALLWLLIERQWLAAVILGLSELAVVVAAEIGMRRSRFRPGSGAALPLGFALTLAIFATSVYRSYVGGGVEWRGRRYGGGLRDERKT
ncbi:MAG TPA: glycosyltransferase family 2 protein [Candidatus Cybelea sp.]|nr:glycosyltransferase family 2 protein [Candidatus Cybelea sp.]